MFGRGKRKDRPGNRVRKQRKSKEHHTKQNNTIKTITSAYKFTIDKNDSN